MSDDAFKFQIDVPIRNDWANVGLLVTSVQNCFNAMFANVDGSNTVAIVTGELLENAIKYGAWSSGGNYLHLQVSGAGETARVTVENPATAESVRELERTLETIRSYPSGEAAFRARLLAIAQDADPEVSKLGLVRISYEGRCTIVSEFSGSTVRVTAEVRLGG